MHDPPFLCTCLTPRSAPLVVRRVTAKAFLVSTQSHHLVELSDAADNNSELTSLFRLTRSALQAGDALEQKVTLIDLLSTKGNLHPLFVGQRHDMTGVSACAPPCFGNKGSKLREADTFVDLLHRPLVTLLLLFLGDSLADHGYLPGSDSDLMNDYLQPAATFALALAIASLPFTIPSAVRSYGDYVTIGGEVGIAYGCN